MTAAELSQVLGPIWDETRRGAEALERIAAAQERIARALEEQQLPPDDTEPAGCAHPEDKRMALGTVGNGWECECGYRQLPESH